MFLIIIVMIAGLVLAIFLLTALVGAPYVPTHRHQAVWVFEHLRPLTPRDVVLDIGSGDGVVLGAAAQQGAQAIGYEINPLLVWVSRLRLRRYGDSVQVVLRDFWRAPFPASTTVVYTFGESRDIARMYARVQAEATRLGRPLELISYGFAVPDQSAVRHERAHYLYHITPLHSAKPQV